MGTKHMHACLVNRILTLLDNNSDPTVDWASSSDRQDPSVGIQKFLKKRVGPSLIPVLVSYLTERKMRVKYIMKCLMNMI